MKYARVYGSALLGLASVIMPAAATAAPPDGSAPSQLLFEWRGRVDKEIRIAMRDGRASVDRVGDRETTNGRVYTANRLPRQDARIYVQRLEGRGRVDVVQQPTRANGYTAIIRVRDPQSGAANYRIRAYTTADGRYDRNGRYEDRDDRWDDRDGPGRRGRGHAYGHYKHKNKHRDGDGRYEDRDDHRWGDRDRDDDRDRNRDSQRDDDAKDRINWPW